MSYKEPDWAQRPSKEFQSWFLVEIKGGVEVAKHPLHERRCTVLGRAEDMVHITIHHESSSRQHARIAFDSQGIPWLKDLQSTHGTICNKKRLPPQAISKVESNSQKAGARGIMIFPGDILRFGASTRIFCVEGPSEFDRGAVQARLQQQKQQQLQHQLAAQEQAELSNGDKPQPAEEGVSWGMDMSDELEQESPTDTADHDNKTLPMDMQVPEKHRKSLERLNGLKYKLANLETEDGRIKRKGELTSGQEKQLQRNAEREEALKKSIFQLETELYNKLYPDKASKPSAASRNQGEFNDEDDDFFDRTKIDTQSVIDSDESEATLKAKWQKIQKEMQERQQHQLFQAKRNFEDLGAKVEDAKSRGDDEEAFYIQNDLDLAKEAVKTLSDLDKAANLQLDEIEKLLKLVNPKLCMRRQSGYFGEGEPAETFLIPKPVSKHNNESTPGTLLPPPVRRIPSGTPSAQKETTDMPPPPSFTMPPPPKPLPVVPTAAASQRIEQQKPAPASSRGDAMMPPPTSRGTSVMPPPKRARIIGPSMPPPFASQEIQAPSTNSTKKHSEKPKAQGTLSFLSSMSKIEKPNSSERPRDEKQESQINSNRPLVDLKKDEWRAPAGQDGSGITKLNAKFAGRY